MLKKLCSMEISKPLMKIVRLPTCAYRFHEHIFI